MLKRMIAVSGFAAMVAAMPAAGQTSNGAKLVAAQSDQYGAYLADADGRALYMFTADKQGQGDAKAESNCYEACAEAWPPLLAEETPQVGDKLDGSLVGTIPRRDGRTQATYGGWPLYYYVKDQGSGSITGQDVHGFGGEWYLVSPDGTKNETEG